MSTSRKSTMQIGNPGQSHYHRRRATEHLDRARASLPMARGRCDRAFPALVEARESLAVAWAEISGISEHTARNRRAKAQLQVQHRELNKRAKKAYEVFGDRCVLGGRSSDSRGGTLTSWSDR